MQIAVVFGMRTAAGIHANTHFATAGRLASTCGAFDGRQVGTIPLPAGACVTRTPAGSSTTSSMLTEIRFDTSRRSNEPCERAFRSQGGSIGNQAYPP